MAFEASSDLKDMANVRAAAKRGIVKKAGYHHGDLRNAIIESVAKLIAQKSSLDFRAAIRSLCRKRQVRAIPNRGGEAVRPAPRPMNSPVWCSTHMKNCRGAL